MADTSTRLFRASLRGRLYRDVELPSSTSLEDLAAAIVSAFGFDFDHAFGFYSVNAVSPPPSLAVGDVEGSSASGRSAWTHVGP